MAFQIKDFASITASIINWMRASTSRITDFNVGSVARTLVEAPAAEMDELYQQMFIGLKEAIPVSVYNSFNFEAMQAVPASGLVRVSITSSTTPTIVAGGTTFKADGSPTQYRATNDAIIPAGSTFADVPVVAVVAGASGNIAAGLSFTLTPEPAGFISAANLTPFASGVDEETDDGRKLRFNAFIESLNRGTVAALRYGLSTTVLVDSMGSETERVVTSSIVEPWLTDPNEPISLVRCYIHNGVGGTSSELVARARQVILGYNDANGNPVPGWKAAGVRVEVFAAAELTVDIEGELTAEPGYDEAALITAAQQALSAYILGLSIGGTAIRSEIIARVMNIEGVQNFVVALPIGDIPATASTKLMPGAMNIT